MKLVLLAALVLAACDGFQAAPTKAPNELLFLAAARQSLSVYEVSNGALVANLPPGAFDATVTPGGDLGEAYVAGADATLYRVRAGRPFRFDRLAEIRGAPPYQAVLVPAPRLTAFVGARTVMVVKGADGSLIGYQAGIQIWREGAAQGSELRRVDDAAVLGLDGNWSLLAPETGLLTPLASDCPDGPLADVQGSLVFACPGASGPGVSLSLGAGPAFDLRPLRQNQSVVAYPSGDWFRVEAGPRISGQGHGAGGPGRPGLSPDGGTIYWPASLAATTVGVSRDGNFLYALGSSGLRVLRAADHQQVAAYAAVNGADIVLVSGG
ncbi:MAG TPA: hypothetical protein VIO84_03775 [Candidatus Dormibacteraeota bacterium]